MVHSKKLIQTWHNLNASSRFFSCMAFDTVFCMFYHANPINKSHTVVVVAKMVFKRIFKQRHQRDILHIYKSIYNIYFCHIHTHTQKTTREKQIFIRSYGIIIEKHLFIRRKCCAWVNFERQITVVYAREKW